MVLTVCSQGSSMATNYIYIYLIFSHNLLICRHSFRQPVWLIQVKLDAFSQQVILHELSDANISPAHILVLLISISTGGSEIMSFSFYSLSGLLLLLLLLLLFVCFLPDNFTRAKEQSFLNFDMHFFFLIWGFFIAIFHV